MEIIFIGAIIIVIGGVVSAIGTLKQNRSSSAKSDKQLLKIEELSQQNLELMKELVVAREEASDANKKAFDNTFGSKGGIFVNGQTHGKLFNQSPLPMYDVVAFVTNYDELLRCGVGKDSFGATAVQSSCYWKNTKRYSPRIVYGVTEIDLPDFLIDNSKPFKVMAKFITKRGTYYQQSINDPKKGYAFRILEQVEVQKHYDQFLKDRDYKQPFELKEEKFVQVSELNKRDNPVDWDKEFPLPVSFSLIQ